MTDDWAAPGTSAAQPRPAVFDADITEPSPAIVRRELPRPLPLRPQSVLESIDSGFAIVRSRPGLLLGATAAFVFPVSAVVAYLRHSTNDSAATGFLDDPSVFLGIAPGEGNLALLAGLVAASFSQMLTAFVVGLLISAWYADRDPDIAEVLRWVLRRFPAVVGAWILVHALQSVGLVVFVFGWLIVAVHTILVAPVMAFEEASPLAAIRRSRSMVRARFAPTLSFFVLCGLMAFVVNGLLTALPSLLVVQFALPASWVLVALGSALASTVSIAVVGSATVAYYIDMRVRLEGIDLQLLILDRFPT